MLTVQGGMGWMRKWVVDLRAATVMGTVAWGQV